MLSDQIYDTQEKIISLNDWVEFYNKKDSQTYNNKQFFTNKRQR